MILVTFLVMILLLSLCNHFFFYFPNPTIVAGNHGYPWRPTECNFSCKPCYVNWNCCWVLCSYNACFLCKCIMFSKFMHIIFMNKHKQYCCNNWVLRTWFNIGKKTRGYWNKHKQSCRRYNNMKEFLQAKMRLNLQHLFHDEEC